MGLIIIVLLVWVFEMQLKNKILFVCMGNICRSPTAEGAFRSIVDNKNLSQNFDIDSAGTHAYHIGNSPDQRALQAAIDNGVDLSKQRARQVHESDFYYYDYIIAMDLFICRCHRHCHFIVVVFTNLFVYIASCHSSHDGHTQFTCRYIIFK